MAEREAEIEVALFALHVTFGVNDQPGEPELTGRYGWSIKVDGEQVASSMTSYESPEAAIEALRWLRANAQSIPIPSADDVVTDRTPETDDE